jgi:NAD(P)H-hydrate epimerase
MDVVTAEQMRDLDRCTIEKDGVPSEVLMDRAGRGVAEVLRRHFPKPIRVVCMAGKGNNGGDARVAAQHLSQWGYPCTLYTEFDAQAFQQADVIIDGLLGTGTRSPLSPEYADFITRVNALQKPVIAIDLPSGLNADTGEGCGAILNATTTVTMALPKLGFFLNEGPTHTGKLVRVDIGIRTDRMTAMAIPTHLVTETDVAPLLPRRPLEAHKGKFGHVLVVAGSIGKMGAGVLASRGALRAGAGLVTYALPESAFTRFDTTLPEVMMEPLPDQGSGVLHRSCIPQLDRLLHGKSALIIGPGIETSSETSEVLRHILSTTSLPIVGDADALNLLAADPSLQDYISPRTILTPHPGEMARLVGGTTPMIQGHRLAVARDFVTRHPCTLVLKGHTSLIATPFGTWFNPTGNPAMATAGMGDVLSGVIGGLVAQGLACDAASKTGVFLHGLAGDQVAETHPQGILASDVADAIPAAIHAVQHGRVCVVPTVTP